MKKTQKIMLLLIMVFIILSALWLFYNQATGTFFSDLDLHLKMALDSEVQNYSIVSMFLKLVYCYLGGYIGIAVVMTLIVLLNIIVTKHVLEYYMEEASAFSQWGLAIMLGFAIAIYIPMIHQYWNLGVQEGNEWHNSTYLCMKPIAMLVILQYLKIQKNYLQKISLQDYIVFCLLLLLVNTIKPNFILAFAPSMLIFLIFDFFKNIKERKAIGNIIIFGSAVLISMGVLVYQSIVLYGQESNSTITFGYLNVLKSCHKYPIISLIQSAAFPLFIFATNVKTILKEHKDNFVFVLNVIALAEYLFLRETGVRATHGNFEWGYSFALFMAFVAAVGILKEKSKEDFPKKTTYFLISYILLGAHVLSGISYYVWLLGGGCYY